MESVKRGYIPSDDKEFGPDAEEKLKAAGTELCFLLNCGYPVKAASTFVGNHHLLSERQRLALARIISTDVAIAARQQKMLTQAPSELVLDGFNTIITLEVALSGSLLIEGMDGTIRDMAGLRGTYRVVDKTVRAVELLMARMKALGVQKALFYLDQQVSNSGRLRALILEKAEGTGVEVQVELHPSVDKQLYVLSNVVTSDAIILDNCKSWYNLNRGIIEQEIPDAWILRLGLDGQAGYRHRTNPVCWSEGMLIRPASLADVEDILRIYAPYIEDTVITFETEVPKIEEFKARIKGILDEYPFFICEIDGKPVGYAYAAKHGERAAYRYSVDVSIYVAPDYQQQGVGKALYHTLFEAMKAYDYYTAYASITLPNEKSVCLHKSFGFHEVGICRNVGYKNGTWLDVIWLEKSLKQYETPRTE